MEARLRLLPHVLTACQAVAYAHSRGVVHRDLKPHNVMLDRFGATYVIDWGLARARDVDESEGHASPDESGALRLVSSDETIGDEGARIGTAGYMSPEHIQGPRSRVNESSDVWGLGAMLYHVLTGRPPRDRGSTDWKQTPPPAHAVAPDVPRDLSALCEKAMAELPGARYPTAEALADDLEAWLQGRQVSAHAYKPRELLLRFVRANRVTVAVAAVLLAALLGLGVASCLRVRTERNQSRAFAHLLIDQVLERLSSAHDEDFTRHLVGEVTDWLSQQGASDDAAAVSWAWFLLAREAVREGAPTRAFTRACLEAARGVDDPVARAASFGCRVLDADDLRPARFEERLARLQALEREIPPSPESDLQQWLEVQSLLAEREVLSANGLVDLQLELRVVDRLVELSRGALARASDRAGALANVGRALANRALIASSLGDDPGALRYGEESIAVARQALAVRPDRTTLEVLAENLAQQASVLRWHAPGAEFRPLAAEARRLFEARLLLDDNPLTRRDYLRLLLDMEDAAEAWRLARPVDLEDEDELGRAMFGYAALASGNAAEVVARAPLFDAAHDFDCALVLALAQGLTGDLAGGAQRLEHVAEMPVVSAWPAPTMNRFARELRGPLAPGLRRFVADLERGQTTNDDTVINAGLRQLAAEWRAAGN